MTAVIFVANTHLSTVRLCLLLLACLVASSLLPVLIGILGPSIALDSNNNPIVDSEGHHVYSVEDTHYWAHVTAVEDATFMLSGAIGEVSIVLLLYRTLLWIKNKNDS